MFGWGGKMGGVRCLGGGVRCVGGGVRCMRVEMLCVWVEGQHICKLDGIKLV